MEIGLRVVRGPHWRWEEQDGGEGHVGTVVDIGKSGSTTSPDKTVVVQWDGGTRTNYRVGYQGAYDLRVFDNAPIGVKHPNIICDECKQQGILGLRWKCTKCFDYDLCSACYFADKHDLNHPFLRFEAASSMGVKVTKRSSSTRLQARGIFPGAKVIRGPDWDWDSQDGGEGKPGKVLDIRGWEGESGRSVANISWTTGITNVYRLGHKGKVDLKYTKDASGGFYYRENLPVLGEIIDASAASITHSHFKVGDKVQVNLQVEILKQMQEGHGGWNPSMGEYIGKMGTVHRITDRGDVRVQYEGCSNRWTFHPGALTKIQRFTIGDYVKISENLALVKEQQRSHGEWKDEMTAVLGQVGKVVKVYGDRDLRILVNKQKWTFNPRCCTLLPHGRQELDNTMEAHKDTEQLRDDPTEMLQKLMDIQPQVSPSATAVADPERLVREAAMGHLEVVKAIVTKYPGTVNETSSGRTALQVAAHQGHRDVVTYLLDIGANVELADTDGDSALHYSAFGNQPEVTRYLLEKNADINALNNGGCTTLHVAVNKQQEQCVAVLLEKHCDVNIQDCYGDTALHDALSKENTSIMTMLISSPLIDFTLMNKRGFNVLHHASLKGNKRAVESILQRTRQLVDMKKDDGFSSLHLAALNGHKDVCEILLSVGRADVEICNNRRQTPLHLAVSQGHILLIKLLVNKGANLNAEDEEGDSCLHLALTKQLPDDQINELLAVVRECSLPNAEDPAAVPPAILLACFLAKHGADISHANQNGRTPMDLLKTQRLRELLRASATAAFPHNPPPPPMLPLLECRVCSDEHATVIFEPCGHRVVCPECSVKMKKCLECNALIDNKLGADTSQNLSSESPKTRRQILELQQKMQDLEDSVMCTICMENMRNVAFMCGHSACIGCAQTLDQCHMCRTKIKKRINLF